MINISDIGILSECDSTDILSKSQNIRTYAYQSTDIIDIIWIHVQYYCIVCGKIKSSIIIKNLQYDFDKF